MCTFINCFFLVVNLVIRGQSRNRGTHLFTAERALLIYAILDPVYFRADQHRYAIKWDGSKTSLNLRYNNITGLNSNYQ